jgi:mRNA interferase RelE/StbE
MAFYKIQFKQSAEKDIRKMQKSFIPAIIQKVNQLSADPFPAGVKKLTNTDNIYRLRVRDYRVIYQISRHEDMQITIHYIRHRKDAYR